MNRTRLLILWGFSGSTLLACMAVLLVLSPRFLYGSDMTLRPIRTLVALLIIAAAAYLLAAALAPRTRPTRALLGWVVGVGLAARLLIAPAMPILEDDFYRYLWDGGVLAHGYNPYRYIPNELGVPEHAPEALAALAEESGLVHERINHPSLGTVYPPLAEAAFATAHLLRPWSPAALKAIYFVCDLAVLGLLALLLRALGLPVLYIALYWWNPLLIRECYNSAHMDMLIMPFALAALYLAVRDRPAASMAALAFAVAAKLWPVLLAPVLLWPWCNQRDWKRLLIAGIVFVLLSAVLLLPILTARDLGSDSGFAAYGARWEMNDALFMVFPWSAKRLAALSGYELTKRQLHFIGRAVALAIVCAVIVIVLRTNRKPVPGARETGLWLCGGALAVAATLFLVSPTQFPWYFIWVLPFLALRPRWSLLLLTALLPLYYLKFFYDAHDNVQFFHHRVVWLEFAPVWILLLYEGFTAWRRGRPCRNPGSPDPRNT